MKITTIAKADRHFKLLEFLSFKISIKIFSFFIFTVSLFLVCSNTVHSAENLNARSKAIDKVLKSEALCQNLGDYYWEIGDQSGRLLYGSSNGTISSDTNLLIASASKLVFAAYIVERKYGKLSNKEISYLEMTSGYDNLNPVLCSRRLAETPLDCFNTRNNNKITTDHIGEFSYNGGHFQKLMIDFDLGNLNNSGLTMDLQNILGDDIKISYTSPQAAAGMSSTVTFKRANLV